MAKHEDSYFEIHFKDPKEDKVVALKARKIFDSPLGLSFVCISDFIFESNALVIQPSEEQMQKRLEDVKSLHISIYSIISIEEKGLKPKHLAFKEDKSKLLVIPTNPTPSH